MHNKIIDIGFQLCPILFSVSLSWSVYNLWQQYPCIVRFGHLWNKKRSDSLVQNKRVMITCWICLILIIILCLYSLSITFRLYEKFNEVNLLLYCIMGLFSFIYLFIPYQINRLIWGLALYIAPDDFIYYVQDEKRKERSLMGRFSEETIKILKLKPRLCGRIIFFNSVFILVLLTLCPLIFCPKSLVWMLCGLIGIVAISLLAYLPYGRWVLKEE